MAKLTLQQTLDKSLKTAKQYIDTELAKKADSSHGTHVTWSTTTPKANGTATVGSETKVARGDHVHPLQTTVSGNAGTATKLATSRTISLGGVLSGSASFDGSANATITAAIANPPKSGDWWSGGIPVIGADGVMEVGKYIDFHHTDASTNDFDTRLQSGTSGPVTITLPSSSGTLALTGHTHNYAGSSSAGGAATSANKVNTNLAIKLNGGSTEGTNLFTFNGSTAKTVNITPSAIGAAASSHGTHVETKVITSGYDTAFRTQTKGDANPGSFLTTIRADASGVTNAPQYGTGLAWGRGDTHGYLYLKYSSAVAYLGAGSADKLTWTKQLAFSDHTHNYAGSSSAGGTATSAARLDLARITGSSNSANYVPGANRLVVREYGNDCTNMPSAHWYHIYTGQGSDANYNTQLAIGMTTEALHFRNKNSGTWGSWKKVSVDGHTHSYANKFLSRDEYTQITVNGDANKYYPVLLGTSNVRSYPTIIVNISRTYSWTAPSTWNTSTHKGGLTFTLEWNCSKYWDGNGTGSSNACYVTQFLESYCTMVAGLSSSTSGIVVWLRGGGAVYQINSSIGKAVTAEVITITGNINVFILCPKALGTEPYLVLSTNDQKTVKAPSVGTDETECFTNESI